LYPFCLPIDQSPYNLFAGIREDAIRYYQDNGIIWHGASLPGLPSNHLVSSPVFSVNVFFVFRSHPEALKDFLSPYFPDISTMIPFPDGQFVDFEWIGGDQNFLQEDGHLGGGRMRGAGNTSVDLCFQYEATDGRKVFVLGEWKYSESYSSANLRYRSDSSDRAETYSRFFFADHSPMNLDLCSNLDYFFYDPLFQALRQQLMASEILASGTTEFDSVKVAQFYCKANKALRKMTSPGLRQFGDDAHAVWKGLLRDPDSFVAVPIEDLMSSPIERQYPDLIPWRRYLHERYSGIC
jgi:hypothetical protein